MKVVELQRSNGVWRGVVKPMFRKARTFHSDNGYEWYDERGVNHSFSWAGGSAYAYALQVALSERARSAVLRDLKARYRL